MSAFPDCQSGLATNLSTIIMEGSLGRRLLKQINLASSCQVLYSAFSANLVISVLILVSRVCYKKIKIIKAEQAHFKICLGDSEISFSN
jgi:hypothetical protein